MSEIEKKSQPTTKTESSSVHSFLFQGNHCGIMKVFSTRMYIVGKKITPEIQYAVNMKQVLTGKI